MYRVLVIDDEPSICKALTMGLTRTDMEVHSTTDGGRGVRRGCAEKFDAFIVDLHLPNINGLEVIRQLKKCASNSVYIVITAYANKDNASDALKSGVDEFFEKPLDMKTFEKVVRRNLKNSGNRYWHRPVSPSF